MQFGKEPQFVARPEKKESLTQKFEKLQDFVKEMSDELKKEGIPVNEKGRVDTDKFEGAYRKEIIEADKDWVDDLKKQWERGIVSGSQWGGLLSREQILRQKTIGETWEMLVTAILHKCLGKDFIVVRTSEYDDFRNGVDSLIIDRASGSIVCAFDEVGDISGQRFEAKKEKVIKRNQYNGGADVFYGLSFKERQGTRQLKKGEIKHIPLFYFASSEDDVRKGLEAFSFSRDGQSDDERKIFLEFIDSFKQQIDELKKYPLHSKFKERLEFFEAILKNMVK